MLIPTSPGHTGDEPPASLAAPARNFAAAVAAPALAIAAAAPVAILAQALWPAAVQAKYSPVRCSEVLQFWDSFLGVVWSSF